jgi:hypothetical protein
MVKYKQQVQDMFEVHAALFNEFKTIHDSYMKDPQKWQEAFNEKGREIIPVLARWENSLCARSESGKYGKFSSNLAEKFRSEVKNHFPHIDSIGRKVTV